MNKGMVPFIAGVALMSAAQISIAAPASGHAAGPFVGAMGGGMRSAPTTMPSRASRDWTMPARDAGWTTTRPGDSRPAPEALLDSNSKLATRLQKLLPEAATPQQACTGFSEVGSCVAALHVADNLDIPFDDLKARMTGPDATSLGGAIRELQPEANADRAQRRAERQARRDLAAAAP